MKKTVSVLLCFVLLFAVIPFAKVSADSYFAYPYLEREPARAPVYSGFEPVDAYVRNIIASETDESMSRAEKLHAVYSYLVWNYEYDYNATYPALGNGPYNVDTLLINLAYGFFTKGYGQCNNYSAAMVLLSLALGYEAKMFQGYYIANSGGRAQHWFSCIKLGGFWWPFDAQIGCQQYTDEGWFGMSPDEAAYHYYTDQFDFAAQGKAFGEVDYGLVDSYWKIAAQFDFGVSIPDPEIPVREGDSVPVRMVSDSDAFAFSIAYTAGIREPDEYSEGFKNVSWFDCIRDDCYFENSSEKREKTFYAKASGHEGLSVICSAYSSLMRETVDFKLRVMPADEFDSLRKGDMNGDGSVRASDARLVLRAAAKLSPLTAGQSSLADVNSDGNVTAEDARLILWISADL